MKNFILFFILLISISNGFCQYPASWWEPADRHSAPTWEILPQDAGPGEVVLSKRTELGVFSNFANTPFNYEGVEYASIEGFWQMMKYPESNNPADARNEFEYPYERTQVANMSGFLAKNAGTSANKIMQKNGFNYISYHGTFFDYKDYQEGSAFHYELIFAATVEKILQSPKLKNLLIRTKGLKLIADHHQQPSPKSYYYQQILMEIRDKFIE